MALPVMTVQELQLQVRWTGQRKALTHIIRFKSLLYTLVGVDYIPVRTEFQFSREAAATQPFFISIIDDTTTESTETIEAVLEGNSLSFNGIALPFPSDRISVAVNSTVIFITENDGEGGSIKNNVYGCSQSSESFKQKFRNGNGGILEACILCY